MPEQNEGMLAPGPEAPVTQTEGPPGITADPAAQEQLDMFVANGVKMIHNPKLSDSIIDKILNAEDAPDAIAEATLGVVERIETGAKQSGTQLTDDTLVAGANELMGEIISMAETAGLEKLSEEDRYRAYSVAVSKYLDGAVKSGKMTTEHLATMSEQAKATPQGQEIVQTAEGMGQLGEV